MSDVDPIVGGRVELQLLTTLKCNLKCSYCSMSVGEVLGSQTELKYDIEQLAAFIERQLGGKEIYVTFYGGEPTLNREMMEAVMHRFPIFRYQLQTNGTLLDKLPDRMLHKLSNILVSIDGGEQTTDGYRGRGVWRQVHKNVNHVRDRLPVYHPIAFATNAALAGSSDRPVTPRTRAKTCSNSATSNQSSARLLMPIVSGSAIRTRVSRDWSSTLSAVCSCQRVCRKYFLD